MSRGRFASVEQRITYLDEVAASEFGRAYKPIALDLLDLRGDERVLDLGCGTGDDARPILSRIGRGGRVVGVDLDSEMLREARRRTGALPGRRLELVEADARALPFADDEFDRARADRVLQMIPDREAALAELIRVTRPGGAIVVSNPGGGSELDVGALELTRRVFRAPPTGSRDGWSGVELPSLFKRLGLLEIRVEPYVHCWTDERASDRVTPMEALARAAVRAGTLADAEAKDWLLRVREAGRAGRFTFVHVLMNVRGSVPG